jgi:TRAP-type C4-dicarboxylate transport system substrate-binding protein
MTSLRRLARACAAAAAGLACAVTLAAAQDLPRANFKVLVQDSPSPQTKILEVPFWTQTVPAASKDRITADVTPIDQVGVDDKAVLRLLKLGVFEFASWDVSKMAGDDARFEGPDLAGIALDIDTARKAANAYRPVLERLMQEKWNVKLLAIGSAPPQVFWCRTAIGGLADLKGKKVRVFNKTMVDFLQGVGAEPVSINFSEVVTALQNGVVDCAVTGTLVGNTGGWTEVTTHLFPMYMGWSLNVHAVNLAVWNRLDAATQAFLVAEFKKFEDKFWDTMRLAIDDAEHCNFGKQPCKMGKTIAHMTPVPVKPEEEALRKKLMESAVLANWAKRAGPDAAKEWNATIGPVVGLRVPAN